MNWNNSVNILGVLAITIASAFFVRDLQYDIAELQEQNNKLQAAIKNQQYVTKPEDIEKQIDERIAATVRHLESKNQATLERLEQTIHAIVMREKESQVLQQRYHRVDDIGIVSHKPLVSDPQSIGAEKYEITVDEGENISQEFLAKEGFPLVYFHTGNEEYVEINGERRFSLDSSTTYRDSAAGLVYNFNYGTNKYRFIVKEETSNPRGVILEVQKFQI